MIFGYVCNIWIEDGGFSYGILGWFISVELVHVGTDIVVAGS